MRQSSDLVCIVLSVGNPPELVDAIESLLDQSEPVDVVVVNSGGGQAAASFAATAAEVVDVEEKLLPGGARNLGISILDSHDDVRHRFVAFLAADCVAQPGWAAARLRAHRDGAVAVAGSITNHYPRSIAAWASHVALWSRRMPGTPASEALLYGLSYARPLLEHYGGFRDDVRGGEDTEFNRRLAQYMPIHWVPSARIAHRNTRSVRTMIVDQYRRGERAARAAQALGGPRTPGKIAKDAIFRMYDDFDRALRAAEPGEKHWIIASAPLLPAAKIAYAAGALRGGTTRLSSPLSAVGGVGRRRLTSIRGPKGMSFGRRRKRNVRLLAMLAFRNEMDYLPQYFENVRPLVDGVIALDDGSTDGSTEYVARQNEVLELIRLPPVEDHQWDDSMNHRRLVEAAWNYRPDWLLGLDADERLEVDFRARAERIIASSRCRAYSLTLREVWDDPRYFRVDGVWGRKRVSRLFQARRDHEFDMSQLHCQWAPLNSRRGDGHFEPADLIIYHLRMLKSADRAARRARYEALDPGNTFQRSGYAYLTDTTGIRLQRAPVGREYQPLPTVREPVHSHIS